MKTKNILFYAPRLPEYDRESGSKRISDHLEMLLEFNWNISFVAQSFAGTELRYKESLKNKGVSVYSGSQETILKLLATNKFDLVILAFWHTAETLLPLIRQASPFTKIIVDSIDLHFLRNIRRMLVSSNVNSDIESKLDVPRDMVREIKTYAAADAVLTVSEKEAEWIKDLTGKDRSSVFCVPDTETPNRSNINFAKRRGILFVGNFWHKPNIQAVNYLCRKILPLLSPETIKAHPVYIVGHALEEAAINFENLSVNVRLVGWVPSLRPYLHSARLSVAPLLYGAGTKRKVLQSLLAGTPVVTTGVGIEGLKLRKNKDILVADDAESFAAAIERLLSDKKLWEQVADDGYHRLLHRHSWENVRRRFKKAIRLTSNLV